MNIKFGMDNFYVRYLKRFLNNELSLSSSILNAFDLDDLAMLIKYLNLPNVKTMFEVRKEIIVEFPELEDLFTIRLKDNEIQWISKKLNKETSAFLQDNVDKLKTFCESCGWELGQIQDWIDLSKDINNDGSVDEKDREILYNIALNHVNYPETIMKKADLNLDGIIDNLDLRIIDSYINNTRLSLTIKQSNRKNYFPNKDMLVFINQFTGSFIYNCAIRGGATYDDIPHMDYNGNYKVALYECKPGQKVTIAHNNTQTVHLVIGSTPATLKQNIVDGFVLGNVVEVDLKPGEGYQYTCTSKEDGTGFDAHHLCIQCPSTYGNLTGPDKKTITLETGDINFDGVVDMQDYHLLASYTATGPGSELYKWEPTPKQLAVMNVRKDETSTGVDIRDAEYLYRFLNHDPAIPDLGLTYYNIDVNKDYESGNNVENLLIIDGHYDSSVNIPFMDFVYDDWVIHDKFFNYLFGMAIHKYSESENISYLQKLLKQIYTEHIYDDKFFYPGNYTEDMRKVVKDFQMSNVSYTIGDLNRDNQLTKADLIVLRDYIDASADYTLVCKYLVDPETNPLTVEQIAKFDMDGDGKITEHDKKLMDKELNSKFSSILRSRADINQDGFVDEQDYVLLESIINNHLDTLTNYNVSFILGWLDVQTEALLEKEANPYGSISEVNN